MNEEKILVSAILGLLTYVVLSPYIDISYTGMNLNLLVSVVLAVVVTGTVYKGI